MRTNLITKHIQLILSRSIYSKTDNQQGIENNITNDILINNNNIVNDIKNVNYLNFLGGFFEGEGSMSVSVSIDKSFKFGVNLQPVFNVTQHKNGLNILHSYKDLFEAGSVVPKSGSPDIWVFTIKGYKKIIKNVIPFLLDYVQPFSCKKDEFNVFYELVLKSAAGDQKNKDTLIDMVNLAYSLKGKGKGKGRKRPLSEILYIIENKETYFKNVNIKKMEAEEM